VARVLQQLLPEQQPGVVQEQPHAILPVLVPARLLLLINSVFNHRENSNMNDAAFPDDSAVYMEDTNRTGNY
jgi:hypothetical protein